MQLQLTEWYLDSVECPSVWITKYLPLAPKYDPHPWPRKYTNELCQAMRGIFAYVNKKDTTQVSLCIAVFF